MADQSEVDRVLSQYGQGYTSPALNSGDGEIASTPDILAQYSATERMSSGVPGFLRRIGAGLRSLAPSQVSTPVNTLTGREPPLSAREAHVNPALLMAGEGADTMASWMDMHPGVDRGQSRPQDLLAPLGLSAMAPLTAAHNSLGIFGGRLARTADREALSRAEEMAGRGVPRETIWDQTGWFQGVDGKWRFEIDDSQMRHVIPPVEWIPPRQEGRPWMAPNLETAYDRARENLTPQAPVRASRLFEHELLQNAYPHGFTRNDQHQSVMGMPVQLIEGGNSAGMFIGNHPNASIGLHETLPPGTARSVALHELQHAIQRREGFAEGASAAAFPVDRLRQEAFEKASREIQEAMDANPEAAQAFRARNVHQARMRDSNWGVSDEAIDELMRLDNILAQTPGGRRLQELDFQRRAVDTSPPEFWAEQARGRYNRTAGEVEARNVQTRRDFSPEARRAVPPWRSQDVPDADQILRQYSAGPQMSVPTKSGDEIIPIFRGESSHNVRGGPYYSPDREWTRQFTQSGRDSEIRSAGIRSSDVYDPTPDARTYAGDPDAIDKIVAEARAKGFKAVRLSEGQGEPPSVYVFNRAALVSPPRSVPTKGANAPAANVDEVLRQYSQGPQMSTKGPPTDEAARLARAREQGFDVENPMYHGTKVPVEAFDLRRAGVSDPGLVGRAVYGTPEREQAGMFAMSPHYGRGDAPNVMPLYHGMRNPAIIQDGVLPDGRTLTEAHPRGITRESAAALNRELKAAGYDGAIFKLGDEVTQYAVFDPTRVRSTRAEFDPAQSRSPNLLASDPSTASLPGTILNQYGPRPPEEE